MDTHLTVTEEKNALALSKTQIPRVGVAVCVIQNHALLLGRRKNAHGQGLWATPGGHLEYGESVEACALRELEEETGLRALDSELGTWVSHIGPNYHAITIAVFVTKIEGLLTLKEPHKCEGWNWFFLNRLPSPLFEPLEKLLQKDPIFHLKS
jgi:8-oxo-dGTP diphosphatase